MKLEKVVDTAQATATGGGDGHAKVSDGKLEFTFNPLVEMGGKGAGTNPEQLFACGYAACFLGAMKFVAGREKIAMAADSSIMGLVGIGPIPNGFGIQVELKILLPGMERAAAKSLVDKAHIVCPY